VRANQALDELAHVPPPDRSVKPFVHRFIERDRHSLVHFHSFQCVMHTTYYDRKKSCCQVVVCVTSMPVKTYPALPLHPRLPLVAKLVSSS
jgi:hypothetical protein